MKIKTKILSVITFTLLATQSSHAAIAIMLLRDMSTNNRGNAISIIEGVIGFNGLWWGTLAGLGGMPMGWVVLNNPGQKHTSFQNMMLSEFPNLESDPEAMEVLLNEVISQQSQAVESFVLKEELEVSLNLSIPKDRLEEILEASYFDQQLKADLRVALSSN